MRKARPGSVILIPLSGSRHVYARTFREATLAVFGTVWRTEAALTDVCAGEVAFYAAVFDTAIRSGEWPIVGYCPFSEGERSWSPPRNIEDVLKPGTYRIYEEGVMRPASAGEVVGLEPVRIYKPEQLVERIEATLA